MWLCALALLGVAIALRADDTPRPLMRDFIGLNGHFTFKPPIHTILAFEQALDELDEEGGVRARGARYHQNHIALCRGMREIGFEFYLADEDQSFIITSFRCPVDPAFRFAEFYERLWVLGFAIYPGKLSYESCFRI